MSEVEQQLDAVEVSITEAQQLIDKSDALRRLERNKDFRFLFLDGLLKEDSEKQVLLLASPQLLAPGPGATAAKKSIKRRIAMIGEFANFCRWIHQEAADARKSLEDMEEARDEILQEQLEED
jgi:hypothetical protein